MVYRRNSQRFLLYTVVEEAMGGRDLICRELETNALQILECVSEADLVYLE